jgi:hypothetical protein
MVRLWIPTLIGCGMLLWCVTGSAGDWQPATAAPLTAGAHDQPAPTPYALPQQRPVGGSPLPGYYAAPGGPAATGADVDPETGRLSFDFAGLRLTQQRTDGAYLLDIELRGLPSEQVEIRPLGRGLLLMVRRSAETERAETFAEGRGYRRSWSVASGQRVKRLPAPPDADLRATQRLDTADAISIRIPRRELNPSGNGALPAAPPTIPQPPGAASGEQSPAAGARQ